MWCSMVFFTVAGCIFPGVQSARWISSMQELDKHYLCVGASITLPWQYELSPGDVITDIQWLYIGLSEELIAISTSGQFLPQPAFGGNRVEQVNNAGIVVNNATVSDTGNYTVEIEGRDASGNFFLLCQTVVVYIRDKLMTQDGKLHVQQTSEAVLKENTDQWSIQLTCGLFNFSGSPPFFVEWITPDGTTHNSTDFNNGNFRLLLDNPIKEGNYTCRIPSHHLADTCLSGSDAHRGEASLLLDKVDARLTLLEKENERLKQENSVLKNSTDVKISQLQYEVQQLRSEDQHLAQRIEKIETAASRKVTFHASSLLSTHPTLGTPLIFSDVITNQGDAYSNTTGYFIAPYAGTYYFVVSSGTNDPGDYASLRLYVDDTQIDYTYPYNHDGHNAFSTLHGVVLLHAGQTVWARSSGHGYNSFSSFSGFILSLDS